MTNYFDFDDLMIVFASINCWGSFISNGRFRENNVA